MDRNFIFAVLISVMELLMASIIIVFAQLLNDPSAGNKYLQNIICFKIYP